MGYREASNKLQTAFHELCDAFSEIPQEDRSLDGPFAITQANMITMGCVIEQKLDFEKRSADIVKSLLERNGIKVPEMGVIK